MRAIVPAAAGGGRGPESDPDIAAAFAGLLDDAAAASDSKWRRDPHTAYIQGHANFVSPATGHSASYSPHSQALDIYSTYAGGGSFLEFHTLSPDVDEQLPSRVVCVHHECTWEWARVAVFSSRTMEWQLVLPEAETCKLLRYGGRYAAGRVVDRFVCWIHMETGEGSILALDTATFQFSRMDLPPPLKGLFPLENGFQLGQTKDGELCVVSVLQCTLFVWLWAADDDGVERFMLHKTFPLRKSISELTELSEEGNVATRHMAVINGFVYLSVFYYREPRSPEWFLSFCLETGEVNLLLKVNHRLLRVDPYLMSNWPSSLVHNKDSETEVTGNIAEDDGPTGTEAAAPVLFTALQSFKQNFIDDGNTDFVEIDDFLLDDERISLVNRIATLESGLAAARNRVLRIGTEANSMKGMEIATGRVRISSQETVP